MDSVADQLSVGIKITTITIYIYNALDKCDIINIGKYIDIDDTIVGLKYKNGNNIIIRGIYNKKNNGFNNQVSMVINYKNKLYNVKIFKNGSIQITGCKLIEDGNKIKQLLIDKIKPLISKNDTVLLIKDTNNNYIDNDNMLYTQTGIRIGYKCSDKYVITPLNTGIQNIYTFDKNINKFVINSSSKYKKIIVNSQGYNIGLKLIKINPMYKKYFNKSIIDDNIVYYNNKIIGSVEYVDSTFENISSHIFSQSNNEQTMNENFKEIDYNCNPYLSKNCEKESMSASINIVFDINLVINVKALVNNLREYKYITIYNPASYSAIKLIYKYSNEINDGLCKCVYKCLCSNRSFMIFKSGKIIGTGFKNYNEVATITDKVIEIVRKYN